MGAATAMEMEGTMEAATAVEMAMGMEMTTETAGIMGMGITMVETMATEMTNNPHPCQKLC